MKLNFLALLYIEQDEQTNLYDERIIDVFSKKKLRNKLYLFQKLNYVI